MSWACQLCHAFAWYPSDDGYLCTNCGAATPTPEVAVSCMTCHEEYTYDPILTTNADEGPECPPCTALLIEKIILVNTGKVTLQ